MQELHPEWLGLAERDAQRFAAGEWWRVVTALFAYDDGAVQTLGIVFGALALGLVAERKIGTAEWLVVAFVSGLAGQIVGLWWQPVGAGSSVAVAGMLGATAIWLAWPKTAIPRFARIGAAVVLALASSFWRCAICTGHRSSSARRSDRACFSADPVEPSPPPC